MTTDKDKAAKAKSMTDSMRGPAGGPGTIALDVDPTAITTPAFAADHPNPEKEMAEPQTVENLDKPKEPGWRREKKAKKAKKEEKE